MDREEAGIREHAAGLPTDTRQDANGERRQEGGGLARGEGGLVRGLVQAAAELGKQAVVGNAGGAAQAGGVREGGARAQRNGGTRHEQQIGLGDGRVVGGTCGRATGTGSEVRVRSGWVKATDVGAGVRVRGSVSVWGV